MKKIITLLLVLSLVCISNIAMASDGPSILKNIDQTMYQTMSEKQLSETTGELFVFQIKLIGNDEPIYTVYENEEWFSGQTATLSFTIGATLPWSFSVIEN